MCKSRMEIIFTKHAAKDFEKVKQNPALLKKVVAPLNLIEEDPFAKPPTFEKLIGFESVYSRRINLQHRLVYQLYENEKVIKIIIM